jgi:hypothetical protein
LEMTAKLLVSLRRRIIAVFRSDPRNARRS